MIPKILHLIWLSGSPYPALIRRCLRSWRRQLPDYEVRIWTQENFDTSGVRYVREAIEQRRWAFAADYIRLWALWNYGGIYLDSDVFVRKSLDPLLSADFFSAVEKGSGTYDNGALLDAEGKLRDPKTWEVPGFGLQAAVLGSVPGHPFLRHCLDYYENTPFILPDGTLSGQHLIAPSIFARMAADFGFRYRDQEQWLEAGMHVLPSSAIASSLRHVDSAALAVHCCNGNWNTWVKRSFRSKLYRKVFPLLLIRLDWLDRLFPNRLQ